MFVPYTVTTVWGASSFGRRVVDTFFVGDGTLPTQHVHLLGTFSFGTLWVHRFPPATVREVEQGKWKRS